MKAIHMNKRLPRSDPEAQGIPSSAVSAFLDDVTKSIHHLHSVMLLRHGQVVAEGWWSPYAPDISHMLYSLSKSFTSSAVGLAVEEGLLSVDDPVLSFFPDEAPSQASANLAAMRVRHLLSMSTGHAEDSTGHIRDSADNNWARAFLMRPVEYEPGAHFLYDSGASYMLSAIVQKLTGMTLVEYLRQRLFEPLGIRNHEWETCPRGVNSGGWGLSITTEDIACFGQMYLQKGIWNGQRVLPESWVSTATSFHSDNSGNDTNDNIDWQQGYGFQFWRCQHNAYRGDGAFGQFCVVMPEQNAVFVTTAGVEDMQPVLDLVWKHLLPAMSPAPLPENTLDASQLRGRLGTLALAPQQGASSPLESAISGRRYVFESNEQGVEALSVQFGDDECLLTLGNAQGEHRIRCGRGAWRMETVSLNFDDAHSASANLVAASCAWTDEDTLVMQLCFYETPYRPTITCKFKDDRVLYAMKLNVSFEATELPQLEGRAT